MRVYPVIMCGGAGSRLWPASTAARPKQFIPLVGDRSTFQDTALRVAALDGLQTILVVAGVDHAAMVGEQLDELGLAATVILEPAARDSAPAMAAAGAWIAGRDPDGIAVVVSADHHLPDIAAFRDAVALAVASASRGQIVTLGVTPDCPSTAYGYIRAEAGEGVRPLEAFVEKPSADTARRYVAEGYLWNSGNFIVAAGTLVDELGDHAPEVLAAAQRALGEAVADGPFVRLGGSFLDAPKISIDYALMEKTQHAAVLPVNFAWSDLGAWDAIWAASDRDAEGNVTSSGALAQNAQNVFIRSGGEARVAVIGARDLAVIVQGQDVLVCGLDHSQGVKQAVEALAANGPLPFAKLDDAAGWYERWLAAKALPLWWCLGADHQRGGFYNGLHANLQPVPLRRARVQCRQAFTYATAGRLGWAGPWRQAARHGWDFFHAHHLRADGLYRTAVHPDGQSADDTALLYDQAFVFLALAALQAAEPDAAIWRTQAQALLAALESLRHPAGGYREIGPHTFQANAHMHLLEGCLAWVELGAAEFEPVADMIIELALTRLIDAEGGFLREVFDADWRPAAGDDGRLVEPGHQFEWAWLLTRWGALKGSEAARATARRLFDAGVKGVDARRSVAVNALWDDMTVRDAEARLWPQTEYLKAAVILGETEHILRAAAGLRAYLQTPTAGLWWDRQLPDGRFRDEPAPASSFYHIIGACEALGTAT